MKESYLSPRERNHVRNTSISALVIIGIIRVIVLLDKRKWGAVCLVLALYAIMIAIVWRKHLAEYWRGLTLRWSK